MTLTPATVRLDLKCGKGSISPGEKCTKGTAQAVAVTQGLEKMPTKALKSHYYQLFDTLVKKYPGKIKDDNDFKKWRSWAASQPENAEANAVQEILQRRRKRGERIFAAGVGLAAAGGVFATGMLTARARRDAFIGNKKLNCGPGSKPCGNACIPKGHKCRASWNKPVKLAAGAAALTGAAVVGTAFLHPRANMRNAARAVIEPTLQTGFGIGNAARGNWAGAAKNAANVAATGQGMGRNLRTIAEGYGTDIKGAVNRGRNAAFKWRHHRPAKRRDSIWAEGFQP